MDPTREPRTKPGTVRSIIMRNRYRTAVMAACGALVVTSAAAGMASAQHPASAEEVTISVSNFPPTTEGAPERRSSSASRNSRRSIRTSPLNRTSMSGRRHVRRPTRGRHAADRVPDPIHRLARPDPARPSGRHHRRGRGVALLRRLQPQRARGRRERRGRHLRSADRRLRHRTALQPGDVRGGRARPRRPADDVGRGA